MGARFCATCGRDLSVIGNPDDAGLPAPPGDLAQAPDPARPSTKTVRPWWFLVAALLVIIGGVLVAAMSGTDDRSPEEVMGLPAIENDEVRALREVTDALKFGDLETDVAAYGREGSLEAIVIIYRNLPTDFSIDGMVRGFAGGVIGSGGTAELDAISTHEIDGVEYICVPFGGRMVPSNPADTRGLACGWAQDGDSAIVLMDSTTTDPASAAGHAADVHGAFAS